MPGRMDITRFMMDTGEHVSSYLTTLFAGELLPKPLFEAMNYSLLAGGKRLRPMLCAATAYTFGVDVESVMPAAAAIECIHCYSLIHDDLPVMDDDDLRRGRPTNHRVFGEATALLAGDALLTYAFELLAKPLPISPPNQLEMIRVLGRAAGAYGMVAGQQADLLAEHTEGTLAELEFIHIHKTAKLLQASVEIGGLFADLTETERHALQAYGMKLGLAFQMMDDWLDVAGTEKEIGKPVGSDERLQKLTYPRLIGLDATKQLAEKTVSEAASELSSAGIVAPLLDDLAQFVVARRT